MASGSLVDALNDLTKSVCPNRIGKLCGISAVPAQVASYAEVASSLSGAAPTICETGFSCGHSTMTFLESNPRVRVVNFDLPTLAWARRAREYMKTRYGSRVTVVDGSSFMGELMAGGALKDRGWQAQPEDQRTIAQLFCDQVGDRVYPSYAIDATLNYAGRVCQRHRREQVRFTGRRRP